MRTFASLLAAITLSISSPAIASQEWFVKTHISPLDDSTNVFVIKLGEPLTMSDKKKFTPALAITCEENKTRAMVTLDGLNLGKGLKEVTLRHGKEKAFKAKWGAIREDVFPTSKRITFIKQLMAHNRFLIQVNPLRYGRTIVEFDTSGLKEAIKPLRKACHW